MSYEVFANPFLWRNSAFNQNVSENISSLIFKLLVKYQDGHGNLIKESGYTKVSYSKFSQNFTRSGCNMMAQNLCFSISF